MGKVVMHAVMSIDGFIADPEDRPGPLFDWYDTGDVEAVLGDERRVFHVSRPSADYLAEIAATTGSAVIGRRLFDITDGWGGRPAAGDSVFVVTHEPPNDWPYPDAPFTFVTEGVERAIELARRAAGDRCVSITAGNVGAQAFAAGLVDEVAIDLAPVVLGRGSRFFGESGLDTTLLGDPRIIQGDRVTHLVFEVLGSAR